MNDAKQIKDGLLYMAIFFGIVLIGIFVPIVILPGILFLPLPFLLFTYKYDWLAGLVFSLITGLLALILFNDLGVLLAVLTATTGVLIGTALHRKARPYDTWSKGALGGIIGFLVIFAYIQLFFQINWEEQILALSKESIAVSEQMMRNFGMQPMTEEQVKMVETQMLSFIKLIPAIIFLTGCLYAYIVQWLGYKFINRIHKENISFPPFRTLRFPVVIIWVYFLALIVTFFQSGDGSAIGTAAENMIVVIGFLLLIQGFSFLFYLSYEKKIPRALPILAILLTVIMPLLFMFIIRLVGVVDIVLDVRKIISNQDK